MPELSAPRPEIRADRLGVLHQAADDPKREDCGALADQQPEVRTARLGHTAGEQPVQGSKRDRFRLVVKEAWVEAGLPDDRIWVNAQIAQRREDLLGDTQVDVPGRERLLASPLDE